MQIANDKRIESLYEEFTTIFGHKSPEFKRGWVAAIKVWNQREIDSFLDELYNDIEQQKYMKEQGGLDE